jgi:hypothetical protein
MSRPTLHAADRLVTIIRSNPSLHDDTVNATALDRHPMRPRVAKGAVAIGNIAIGGIAIGGLSCGLFAIGGVSLGILLALGGAAMGFGISAGGFAIGSVAIGGAAIGFVYATEWDLIRRSQPAPTQFGARRQQAGRWRRNDRQR